MSDTNPMIVFVKTVTAKLQVTPRRDGRKERRTAAIHIEGRWLEALGFQSEKPVYVGRLPDGKLVLSPEPFYVNQPPVGSLEDLRAKYAELGIPTTRDTK